MTMRGRVKLDPERRLGTVDRKIYGNFTEHLGRCIYGGMYQPGSPLADENGFRRDVLQAARGLRIPILRWPGGNFVSGYHWEDGIGPRDQRPRRRELAWHAVESNQFGTDDFITYCRALGADPYICVNMGSGTMDEAANWLEYCNSAQDTHYADLRRKNGHADPYTVEYWGLGNEVYGAWQIGHKSASDYATAALEFAKMFKWIDKRVKLVACGAQKLDWDSEVLNRTGRFIDYISAHFYWGRENDAGDSHYSIASGPYEAEEYLQALAGLIQGVRREQKIDHPISIAVDEWNVWYRARDNMLEEHYDLTDALVVAAFMNVLRRNCRTIGMANLAQMVNVIAPIFTSPDAMFLQTIYWPLHVAANYSGDIALDAFVESDSFTAPRTLLRQAPCLDVGATLDETHRKLFLSIVNLSKDDDADVQIELGDMRATSVTEHLISGPAVSATNDFDHPNTVGLKSSPLTLAGTKLAYELSAHSASVLEIALG